MNDRLKKVAAISVIVTPVLFFILTTIGMFLFPGGYSIDGIRYFTTHYTFDMNFFSDLGMLITETWLPNYASSILFCIATTLVGVAFIFYAITVPSYFEKNSIQWKISIGGAFFAIISSIGFIGIGFTPWDVLLGPHMIAVFTGFPVSTVFSALFCVAIFMGKKYPNIYGYLFAIFTVCMVTYVIILFEGPTILTIEGRIFQVLAQKVIVYLMMIMIPVQAVRSLIVLKRSK